MRVRLDFAASVPKDTERPDLNEDAFQCSLDGNVFALSDGASESYDSKSWAKMLVNQFIENQQFNYQWVLDSQAQYESSVDFQALSWSKQLAFDRGSFATLLALTSSEGDICSIFSIGDCLAVLIRGNKCIDSFPFKSPEQFDARPELLSTISNLNAFTQDGIFELSEHLTNWKIENGDVILMMTDAVGQWFLRETELENNSIKNLLALCDENVFQDLICSLRNERRIKLDDSTVLRFVVDACSDEIDDGISNH